MDASANITAAVFAAYLKCPTKAYLMAHREKPPNSFVADTLRRIATAYKARIIGSSGTVPIDFSQLSARLAIETTHSFIDCESTSYASGQPVSVKARRLPRTSVDRQDLVPVLYSAWNKIDQSDNLHFRLPSHS
jgi:hypothetical protein